MIKDIQQEAETRMKKSLSNLGDDFAKLRTGRAHPSLLDGITVIYYNNSTPLNQVASISVEDARTLSITPWEKNLIPAIEKAIRSSDLGLNPATSGTVVRVPLPPLTEERRRTLVKHIKTVSEEAKVSVRNVRRDANTKIKDLLKAKKITEDEEKRGEEAIQKLTDRYILDIDKHTTAKETELMQV